MSGPDEPISQLAMPLTETGGLGDECGDGCCPPAPIHRVQHDDVWRRAAGQARALSWFSLAWMTCEGVLGLIAGAAAGSIALIGWGLGSVIEGLAAVIVIWCFTGSRTLSATAEGRAQQAVAVSFFLLAPYIAVQAGWDLVTGHQADATVLGIALTASSLIVMPILGVAKQRLGRTLDSGATAGEGVQNLLCAAQAGAVLLGLAITATLGWQWVDPVIGLAVAAIAVREGRRAWRGDGCC